MTHCNETNNNQYNHILKISNRSAFKPYKNKYKIYFNDVNLKIKIEENGNIKIINNIAELAEKCLKNIDFATSKM